MHAAARRCGRRAHVQSLDWRRIRYESEGGPRPELPNILNSAVDVASDIVGIVLFHCGWRHDTARKDAVTKARCEALDLRFNAPGHIERRAAGDMAIGPGRVFSLWRARGIEQGLLDDNDVWPLRVLALPDGAFR